MLAALIGVLVLIMVSVASHDSGKTLARLTVTRGSVWLISQDEAVLVPVGDRWVGVGAVVRTDATGQASIAYFRGSETRIGSETSFKVIDLVDGERRTIAGRISEGRVWNTVRGIRPPSDRFEIRTPHAWAGSHSGRFAIDCGPAGECKVVAIEKTSSVVIDGGESVELAPGECVVIDAKGQRLPFTDARRSP